MPRGRASRAVMQQIVLSEADLSFASAHTGTAEFQVLQKDGALLPLSRY